MISGSKKAKSAVNEYNSYCVNKRKTTTLNFGITNSGGLGLALVF